MEKFGVKELIIAIILAAIVIGIIGIVVTAIYPPTYGYGMMGGYGMMWVGMIFMPIPIIFIILIILFIFGDRATICYTPTYQPSQQNAIEILNQRYAKGEISREEYMKTKKDFEDR